MSGPALPPLSRRTALLTSSGSIAAVLTSCRSSASADAAATDAPTGDPTSNPTTTPTARANPDAELVRRALDREVQARRDALRTAQRHPELSRALRRTADVHQAHTKLLQQSLEVAGAIPDAGPVARDPHAAARTLAGEERALADAHARAALDARSGPLARVLAGMAAAADQQAQLLDDLAATVRRRG